MELTWFNDNLLGSLDRLNCNCCCLYIWRKHGRTIARIKMWYNSNESKTQLHIKFAFRVLSFSLSTPLKVITSPLFRQCGPLLADAIRSSSIKMQTTRKKSKSIAEVFWKLKFEYICLHNVLSDFSASMSEGTSLSTLMAIHICVMNMSKVEKNRHPWSIRLLTTQLFNAVSQVQDCSINCEVFTESDTLLFLMSDFQVRLALSRHSGRPA